MSTECNTDIQEFLNRIEQAEISRDTVIEVASRLIDKLEIANYNITKIANSINKSHRDRLKQSLELIGVLAINETSLSAGVVSRINLPKFMKDYTHVVPVYELITALPKH